LISKSRGNQNISTIINKALNEIKKELVSSDRNVKIHAIQKLLFLYLNHYDIKWASFQTLEILATCGAPGKRNGYTIGQLQYKNSPDYLMLIPQLIRKDLMSQNFNFINSALNFLNGSMDLSLAKELLPDLEKLLNLSNNLIRKKLVLALTKASEKILDNKMGDYWDDLAVKLMAILADKSLTSGLAICIISSIQRVCSNYPQRCMTVFVELMNYFTKCEVNWNLIKIIDIFSMLFTYEKKFTKKKDFVKIFSEQLSKTKSKSVEVQLVKLIITHFDVTTNPAAHELIQNCEERLKTLLFFHDNNLVLISLRILKDLFNKKKITNHTYLNDILKILDSYSQIERLNKNIQLECLEIINLLVSQENYKKIVEHLFSLKDQLGSKMISTILDICTFDTYSRLTAKEEFIWFIDILFSLAESDFGKSTEAKISFVIRDIAQRIDDLRPLIVEKSFNLISLLIQRLTKEKEEDQTQQGKIIFIGKSDFFSETVKIKNPEKLISVLTFIVGEYSNVEVESLTKILKTLLNYLKENEMAKEQYFLPISHCIIKLLFKSYTIISLSDDSMKESLEKFEKVIDYKSNFGQLDILEMNKVIETIIREMNPQNKLTPSLCSHFFEVALLPIHEKAQTMIHPPKDIEVCFPLDEEELNVNKNKEETMITDVKCEFNEIDTRQKENIGTGIKIDKNIYIPNLVKNE
jgi:hypothetical protein